MPRTAPPARPAPTALAAQALAIALLVAPPMPAQAQQRLLSVPKVDLQRYAGTWYEIARLPNQFQSQCVSDVTATYAPRDDGNVAVTNRCRTGPGADDADVAEGVARPVDDTGAKLKVSFLPGWLQWLPFARGDYWVLELDEQYRHALVGEPGRRYLWLLSRTPELPQELVQDVLGRAREMGFPTDRMTFTTHTAAQ
jgi:apolipoprotein D and lipocalin family protein